MVLARTKRVAISLENIAAFESGLTFALVVRLAPSEEKWREGEGLSALHGRHFGQDRPPTPIDPAILRFGVEYADGRRVTNVWTDMLPFFGSTEGPVLSSSSGGMSERDGYTQYWMAPLPPPGRVMFAVEWPSRNLAFTSIDVDADVFKEAATRSVSMWPEPEPDETTGRSVWQSIPHRRLHRGPK
ncbi:MAG: hypothetical protein ACRDHM_03830 [Actinomycetota bacterium]